MLTFPDIDPVAFQIGPLQVRWYGIMYLLAFGAAWGLGRIRATRPGWDWTSQQVADVVFYGALGAVLGGRIGYVIFYAFDRLLDDPLFLLKVWTGGMSFHGGLLGVIVALWLFGRGTGKGFAAVADFVAPLVPPGLAAGRLGNFVNGELWGKVSDLPWAMRLPCSRDDFAQRFCEGRSTGFSAPHHPSQLYEMVLEGLVLFAVLWWFSRTRRPPLAVSGMFLLFYGLFRFVVEFVRLPDPQLGYQAFGWLTRGQQLSLPMVAAGVAMLVWAYWDRSRTRGARS